MARCWEDSRVVLEAEHGKPWWECTPDGWDHVAGTCMLEDGHGGPHEFTADFNITVEFSAETTE